MPVVLYMRHSPGCEIRDNTRLSDAAKRRYRGCGCPIWVSGKTEKREFPRQTTGYRDWKEAEAWLAAELAVDVDQKIHGPLIDDCIERYLDARRDDLKSRTHDQHELLLTRLSDYALGRRVTHMDGLSVDLCEDFVTYGLKHLASNSRATSVAKLNCFLKEAARRKWTGETLKVRTLAASYEAGNPYADDEVDAILKAAGEFRGGTVGFASCGPTFRLLLEVMLQTGMRGSAANVRPDARVRS